MKSGISDMINEFYDKLWELHNSGALNHNDDEIALKILNAIDDSGYEF